MCVYIIALLLLLCKGRKDHSPKSGLNVRTDVTIPPPPKLRVNVYYRTGLSGGDRAGLSSRSRMA